MLYQHGNREFPSNLRRRENQPRLNYSLDYNYRHTRIARIYNNVRRALAFRLLACKTRFPAQIKAIRHPRRTRRRQSHARVRVIRDSFQQTSSYSPACRVYIYIYFRRDFVYALMPFLYAYICRICYWIDERTCTCKLYYNTRTFVTSLPESIIRISMVITCGRVGSAKGGPIMYFLYLLCYLRCF